MNEQARKHALEVREKAFQYLTTKEFKS
ncbi:unnamed protein product [Rotaria sp. Silwood2]|nr:unnamed protein product [Rotaria sp. Silwood2]